MEFIALFILGACVGSFLNVLIDRLPAGENIFIDRSHCDWCKKTLRWYELLPIISFCIQRGRCLRCHKPLWIQYPLVEAATGVAFAYVFTKTPDLLLNLYVVGLFAVLIVLFVADLKYQILPDSMIAAGVVATILYGFTLPDWQRLVVSHVGSAAAAMILFFLMWVGTRGKGLGFGDVKLVFLLGLLLGHPGTIIALYVAFLTGAGVGVILMIERKKTLKSKVAFGPFLILGTVATLLFEPQAMALWHRFVGF